MQLPAWHSCPASPPQTASCFPCHFPGGGHLSGQLLSLLCLSLPHPFSPSSHPGTEQFMQWLNRLNAPSTLTTESFKKKKHKHLKAPRVSLTFPFAAVVLLPSRSSEKSVSDEKRVSVSLLSTRKNNLEKTPTTPRLGCEIPAEAITYWGKGNSDGISGAAIIFVTSSGELQLKTGV